MRRSRDSATIAGTRPPKARLCPSPIRPASTLNLMWGRTAKAGGVRRLVFEVHRADRQIREIYYTDEHYGKGSFVRIV